VDYIVKKSSLIVQHRRGGVVVTFSPSKRERWVRFPPATIAFAISKLYSSPRI
jgi:hypothetical protein